MFVLLALLKTKCMRYTYTKIGLNKFSSLIFKVIKKKKKKVNHKFCKPLKNVEFIISH